MAPEGEADGRVKFVRHVEEGTEALFDLIEDPGEHVNVLQDRTDADALRELVLEDAVRVELLESTCSFRGTRGQACSKPWATRVIVTTGSCCNAVCVARFPVVPERALRRGVLLVPRSGAPPCPGVPGQRTALSGELPLWAHRPRLSTVCGRPGQHRLPADGVLFGLLSPGAALNGRLAASRAGGRWLLGSGPCARSLAIKSCPVYGFAYGFGGFAISHIVYLGMFGAQPSCPAGLRSG